MNETLRILFVGDAWLGSCARSMREALARQPGVRVDDVNESVYFPSYDAFLLRATQRLLAGHYRKELYRALQRKIDVARPDYLVVYKGWPFDAAFLNHLHQQGIKTVNIYPDRSPHAYGPRHRAAVGAYFGVISSKPFHPANWRSVYGYTNRCAFVPQGYDPLLHLVEAPVTDCPRDVTMVATWHPEYHALVRGFAQATSGHRLRVGIAGSGWRERRDQFPADWEFPGALQGQAYVDWLRSGRICLAPVRTASDVAAHPELGDVDTTRTYELAAAHCFFIHRDTPRIRSLYDPSSEVPVFADATDLAEKTLQYLHQAQLREQMAAAAHRRAVPAYGNDARAAAIATLLRDWRTDDRPAEADQADQPAPAKQARQAEPENPTP